MTPHSANQKRSIWFPQTAAAPSNCCPRDPEPQQNPDWSPDGDKIVFGGVPADDHATIRVLDLNTHQVSTLPGSRGLFAPFWSPDGRYIVAMPSDSLSLVLFDFQTQSGPNSRR